ncbi:Ubiquitin-conjugating enzyme E2 U [Phlyctochytrium bullatum]|nr:Ubiquitin-conjugating enzyme E2 U [Phlyctochytrium bullatum]
MASRAYLLLQRELHRIKRDPLPWGITANVVLGDIYQWKGTIHGPADTSWEGGIFQVDITFGPDHDEVPPVVRFVTVPFHPNIEMQSGKPCLDLLDDLYSWKPGMTVVGLLLCLQQLMVHPDLTNPVNAPAAEIYVKSRRLYDQLARDCVVASRRVAAGLPPHGNDLDEGEKPVDVVSDATATVIAHTAVIAAKPTNKTNTQTVTQPKVARLSFDDYHQYWKSIATSIPLDTEIQQKSGVIVLEGKSSRAKLNESQFKDMVERQKTLWYGNFTKSPRVSSEKKTPQNPRPPAWKYPEAERVDAPSEHGSSLGNPSINGDAEVSKPNVPGNVILPTDGERAYVDGESHSSHPSAEQDNQSYSNSLETGSYYDEMDGNNGDDWEKEALELEEWTSSLPQI